MTLEELNMLHPVGEIYQTVNTGFNPNNTWGGTWTADNTESVLVSQQTGNLFSAALGNVVGANTAVTNLPNHTHNASAAVEENGSTTWFTFNVAGTNGCYGAGTWSAAAKGGGGSHENRMRSKYVIRWVRTA